MTPKTLNEIIKEKIKEILEDPWLIPKTQEE